MHVVVGSFLIQTQILFKVTIKIKVTQCAAKVFVNGKFHPVTSFLWRPHNVVVSMGQVEATAVPKKQTNKQDVFYQNCLWIPETRLSTEQELNSDKKNQEK